MGTGLLSAVRKTNNRCRPRPSDAQDDSGKSRTVKAMYAPMNNNALGHLGAQPVKYNKVAHLCLPAFERDQIYWKTKAGRLQRKPAGAGPKTDASVPTRTGNHLKKVVGTFT